MTARILLPFLCLLAMLRCASALEVSRVEWGFDGSVVPDRFAPLALLVENPASEAFDGEVALFETRGLADRAGGKIVQPLYVGPQARRWVQFYPCVPQNSEWALEWDGGRFAVPAPKIGAPARVFLRDSEDLFAGSLGVRSFPSDLFPTAAAATDALDAVALDHAPRWEAARREAFLGWLRGGGVVHLLRDAHGEFPAFTGDLAVLNSPLPETRVERGRIVRHDLARRELTADFFEKHGSPAREMKEGRSASIWNFDSGIFRLLGSLTRPDIDWSAILALSFLYVLFVGPAHYFVGRRLDYRVTIAIYLAVVALFGFVITSVGRRGQGEKTLAHTISVARSLGGDSYLVTQWTSLFVTKGGEYAATYAGPGNLFSTPGESGPVNAVIKNGRDGRFVTEMPLYSSRPVLHSGVMTGDAFAFSLEGCGGLDQPWKIKRRAGPEPIACWLRSGGRIWKLEPKGGDLLQSAGKGTDQESFLANGQYNEATNVYHASNAKPPTSGEVMEKTLPLMLAWSLGGSDEFAKYVVPRPLETNQVELFVAAPMPEGFKLAGPTFAKDDGIVLYRLLATF